MNRHYLEVFGNQGQSHYKCGKLITCHFGFCGKFSTKLDDLAMIGKKSRVIFPVNSKKTSKLWNHFSVCLQSLLAWCACTVVRLSIWTRDHMLGYQLLPEISLVPQTHTEDQHLRDHATLWSTCHQNFFPRGPC